MKGKRFDPTPVLARLKDFQRRTAEAVLQRLYLDNPPARRFLVADEVGLGKTLVARGIIALTLEYLHDKRDRIDVVYICSNATIATQNVNRLNVAGSHKFAIASRLTLLPTKIANLTRNPVNFISFTPGTTFDPKSRDGAKEERVVLYRMLRNETWLDAPGLLNLLQCRMRKDRWRWWAKDWTVPIDPGIREAFKTDLCNDVALSQRLVEACRGFHRYRNYVSCLENDSRLALVADLRHRLSICCLRALKPELVILDEFQRFKDLLHDQDEAAVLAQALFNTGEARVLLLSATPYKMLSLDHEQDDDHYPDFLRTLGFLFNDDTQINAVKSDIQRFRQALYALAEGDGAQVAAARVTLQERLRRVMYRTERVSMTIHQDAMLEEHTRWAPLCPDDLRHARLADQAAHAVGARDPIEYWKSAPYLLNFLRGYELRHKLDATKNEPPTALLEALQRAQDSLLTHQQIEDYTAIDPANARMRSLFADTLERGLWRVLWLPPSLPYSIPSGAYAQVGDVTKALVFSTWNVVPDAIAALCSYEAERRMLAGRQREWGHDALYDHIRPLLRFTKARDGRLTGMPTLALLLPAPTLATVVDPLRLALEEGTGAPIAIDRLLTQAEDTLRQRLEDLVFVHANRGGLEDQRWYWAASVLLDATAHPALRTWGIAADGWAATGAGHEEDVGVGFHEHRTYLIKAMDGDLEPRLGRPPEDLLRVLAELALAAPGTCALRALRRVAPMLPVDDPALLSAAARVAGGFRTLFNLPESIGLLRGETAEETYWRLVLSHGLDGNLQALLDEQVHVLQESLGLLDVEPIRRVTEIGGALAEALSIRTAQLRLDELRPRPRARRIEISHFNTRCRFALRFGELRDDKDNTLARADTVRMAFNSPFRPFILASTSIGQEGLDFHTWCHAVVHWNLPSNPVDLEQREGRVHRYKGHAVRKNIVQRYGLKSLSTIWDRTEDPWKCLFDLAARERPVGTSDLVPYWVFEVDGGAKIERRVPLLPLSKEVEQLQRLKRGLALYRLVFGQPRQEDLLAYLDEHMTDVEVDQAVAAWHISLTPDLCEVDKTEEG